MSSADRKEPLFWLRSWPQRYGFALVAVAAATGVRYGLDVALGFTNPFILFYPAIMLIALLVGFGPGLLATVLSAVAATYLFLVPLNSFSVRHGLVVFAIVGITISWMGDLFRRRGNRLQEFEKAVEGLEEMIVVVDRDYRYLIANRAFLKYRGMKIEDLAGRRIPDVLSEEIFKSTVKEKLDECFRGKIVQFEMRSPYPSLGDRDLSVSCFPIEGPRGVDRVATVLQDITERKRADAALEASEKRFRTVYERSPVGIALVDPGSGRFLKINPKFCEILGRTEDELLELDCPSVTHPDDVAEGFSRARKLTVGETAGFEMEKRYLRPDGREVWANVSVAPMWRQEEPQKVDLVMAQDISERKRAEAALLEREDRYRYLVEHSQDLVCTHDLEGRLLTVNPAPARVLGYEASELVQKPMRDLVAPEWGEQFDAYLDRIKTVGADQGLLCVITRNGDRRIWEYHNTLRTEGVASPTVRGMARDVTETKMAELALRHREEDYRRFVAQSSEGIFREELDAPLAVDLPEDELVRRILADSYMIECNDAFARMYGFTSARELVGKRLTDMLVADHPNNLEMTREYIRSGFKVMERESHEVDIHGNPKVFQNSLIGIVENGKLLRTWGIQRDVTEQVRLETDRTKAQKALQTSENHFRLLVEQASDGIFIADPQGKYVDVNSAGAEMLGYTREEILRLSFSDILVADQIPRLAAEVARFAEGATIRSEWNFLRKDGSCFPGEVSGKLLPDGRLQGILRDISERRQAEAAMRWSEERFRVALKDSPITVFSQDCELRYTWIYNPQIYWHHQCLGKTDTEILGPRRAAGLTDLKCQVLRTGIAQRQEVTIPNNGKSSAFDITIEPLFDAGGRVVGITGAAMDIARLKEITDRLQDAKDKLAQEKSYLESEIQQELGFEEIIGQSPALHEVLKNVRVVAPTDSTVMLLGETGTGKELVARSVHSLSSRRDKTFIKLNCAAVPSGLLESELFGHEKGAFTGAVSQKVGRIELADKGTLFLDEIGELPLELQPKLLRVLQDREFERLGGVRTLHVDVRIISATNRDLPQEVADKTFREDLFYRLNVFPIELPALRDRRSDIPILIQHFVKKHAARMGKRIDTVPDETTTLLQDWNWPGNIRELENMIERMVILTKGTVLAAPPTDLDAPQELSDDNLTEMKREHIMRVLRETGGVLSGADGAASRLGLKRTTLQSMLKRHGIELQNFRRGSGMFGAR